MFNLFCQATQQNKLLCVTALEFIYCVQSNTTKLKIKQTQKTANLHKELLRYRLVFFFIETVHAKISLICSELCFLRKTLVTYFIAVAT